MILIEGLGKLYLHYSHFKWGENIVIIVNMTPHSINLMDDDKNVILMPASGNLIRLASKTVVDSSISFNGVDVTITKTVYGEPVGLPEE